MTDQCPRSTSSKLPARWGSTGYPDVYKPVVAGREKIALGNAVGLTQFGVNLTRLKPGAASALRHWHENEDEFVYMLEGEAGAGGGRRRDRAEARRLRRLQGQRPNGHHLINRTDRDVLMLEVGTRAPREVARTIRTSICGSRRDDEAGIRNILHKDGTPY